MGSEMCIRDRLAALGARDGGGESLRLELLPALGAPHESSDDAAERARAEAEARGGRASAALADEDVRAAGRGAADEVRAPRRRGVLDRAADGLRVLGEDDPLVATSAERPRAARRVGVAARGAANAVRDVRGVHARRDEPRRRAVRERDERVRGERGRRRRLGSAEKGVVVGTPAANARRARRARGAGREGDARRRRSRLAASRGRGDAPRGGRAPRSRRGTRAR